MLLCAATLISSGNWQKTFKCGLAKCLARVYVGTDKTAKRCYLLAKALEKKTCRPSFSFTQRKRGPCMTCGCDFERISKLCLQGGKMRWKCLDQPCSKLPTHHVTVLRKLQILEIRSTEPSVSCSTRRIRSKF